jgi:ribosomal protein S18 acetylase RimI-like enzyme
MLIRPPTAEEFEPALMLAFRHLAPEEKKIRVQTLVQAFQRGAVIGDGIVVLDDAKQIAGVLYSQQRPDGSVLLFPPVAETTEHLETLYDALDSFCRQHNASAAVLLVDHLQVIDRKTLEHYGHFEFLSEMVFLVSALNKDEIGSTVSSLVFESVEDIDRSWQRIVPLVEKTYQDSKDFPRLMGLMPIEGVLKNYQSVAAFSPDIWFFVQHGGQDIGVLLLTDTQDGQLEITYMGLIPEVRGKGFGKELIRFAQQTAANRNGTFLLTSVDEQNAAALKSYLAAGFQAWDRKRLFIKILR